MRKHNHYFKPCPFSHVDVYRVLVLFDVSDPCLQHAIKKLLVAGGRGSKDAGKDVAEAIDSLIRWQEMRKEEAAANTSTTFPPIETVAEVLRDARETMIYGPLRN